MRLNSISGTQNTIQLPKVRGWPYSLEMNSYITRLGGVPISVPVPPMLAA